MDIRISGHQVDTGEALKVHVEDRLNAIVEKYFSKAISSQVTFGRGPHDQFQCDIVTHVMQGLILKGQGTAQDAHVAFDGAAEKIDKQLRRYMGRLKGRQEQVQHALAEEEAAYTVFDSGSEEDEAGDFPVVIAETRVDVPEATVSDAVMMLDLRNTTALFFKNTGTGRHNMVYRRADGSIGWVEPQK
ncbi:ribosome hibernation-promoting factor, HPF/YfiA family [Blastomonas aquatica]|uniref:Ribosome hibernation promoting factor n=1 Tax=Blastomonas aquatica TaxID=1510276 RepID=A0ABQ1IX23_9SPHN|nr:ribosome-associated translation inhibitor RaiA [Blastomonas aquatica]GGB54521.1 ribosomal subunit interface protein [Blastomonas aquatica]